MLPSGRYSVPNPGSIEAFATLRMGDELRSGFCFVSPVPAREPDAADIDLARRPCRGWRISSFSTCICWLRRGWPYGMLLQSLLTLPDRSTVAVKFEMATSILPATRKLMRSGAVGTATRVSFTFICSAEVLGDVDVHSDDVVLRVTEAPGREEVERAHDQLAALDHGLQGVLRRRRLGASDARPQRERQQPDDGENSGAMPLRSHVDSSWVDVAAHHENEFGPRPSRGRAGPTEIAPHGSTAVNGKTPDTTKRWRPAAHRAVAVAAAGRWGGG